MHRPPHRLIAAEGEGEVRQAARNMDVRAALLDLPTGLAEVYAVIIVLLDPGRHGEGLGVEDDVLRREVDGQQQLVGAFANLDLAETGSASCRERVWQDV